MRLIHLLRKPVSEGTVASNVLKHGVGAINIEASRISTKDSLDGGAYAKNPTPRADSYDLWTSERKGDSQAMRRGFADYEQPAGRWPGNLILQHLPECRCEGTRKIKGNRTDTRPDGDGGRADKSQWRFRPTDQTKRGFSDDDGNETVANWTCVEGCPVADLDCQSGDRPSGGSPTPHGRKVGLYEDGLKQRMITPYNDTGGASRFFKQVGGEK